MEKDRLIYNGVGNGEKGLYNAFKDAVSSEKILKKLQEMDLISICIRHNTSLSLSESSIFLEYMKKELLINDDDKISLQIFSDESLKDDFCIEIFEGFIDFEVND